MSRDTEKCEDVMLEVESRLGIDVHDGGAAIAELLNAKSQHNTDNANREKKIKKQNEKNAKRTAKDKRPQAPLTYISCT